MDIVGYNGIGRAILIPELPLEPAECWEDYEEEYDDD